MYRTDKSRRSTCGKRLGPQILGSRIQLTHARIICKDSYPSERISLMLTMALSRRLKIGVLVHEVSRLRRRAIDELLQPVGITGTQWWLLTYVSLRPGLAQARLAEELNLG